MIKFFKTKLALLSDGYFLMIFAFVFPIVNVIVYFVAKYVVFTGI